MTSEAHSSMNPHESAATQRPTKVRWTIFSLACGTSFMLYLHRYTWNFIGPFLEKDFGFSKTELGTLFSFFTPTYGAGQIPSGILCDLIGPHAFLGVIIVLWSLLIPCYGIARNFTSLAALRLIIHSHTCLVC